MNFDQFDEQTGSRSLAFLSAKIPGRASMAIRFHRLIWLPLTPNCDDSSASVRSSRIAANATFAL